ncbi:hypothetical protein N657DRAFT_461325 [Parathielavia appendiculata]|uniref:Uncharacterized protein n=1 Tax=Parathielavia appendiculata TaxID=2587402 RepID=A0AAN6Z2N8_9PEZI|nr:hypothetical protein N657DRAFT_461325 [Parathielavia appendiculata]
MPCRSKPWLISLIWRREWSRSRDLGRQMRPNPRGEFAVLLQMCSRQSSSQPCRETRSPAVHSCVFDDSHSLRQGVTCDAGRAMTSPGSNDPVTLKICSDEDPLLGCWSRKPSLASAGASVAAAKSPDAGQFSSLRDQLSCLFHLRMACRLAQGKAAEAGRWCQQPGEHGENKVLKGKDR